VGERVQVVSYPDPDYPQPQQEHLWLLVGGGDYSDGSQAFYLGPDRDIEGNDLAAGRLQQAIESARSAGLSVDPQEVDRALADYRRARG
jgi:hypothetical protein